MHAEEQRQVQFVKAHVIQGFEHAGSKLFHELLNSFNIRLHDLAPNSILHVTNFHIMCEDYMGIKPSMPLWNESEPSHSNAVQYAILPVPALAHDVALYREKFSNNH